MVTTDKPGGNGAGADHYRDRWKWDKVTWGSHAVDCYPGGCPFRVYVKDGKIVREEQAGTLPVIQQGVPDMNPMGCQKGACWGYIHYGPDRVTQPLKRVGERGEGKFEPVSWDEALTDIADAMLDACEDQGPESVITLMTPEPGAAPARAYLSVLGSPLTDGNAEFQDWSPGYYITWGKFNPVSSMDDWFLAELTLIWHCNPVYTNIHWFHYIAGIALQRRRGHHHRAGLQPIDDPLRPPHTGAHRHGRSARAGDVQGDHRREALPQEVRPGADGPADARPDGHRKVPARPRGTTPATATTSSSGGTRRQSQIVPAPRGTLAHGRRAIPALGGHRSKAKLLDGTEVEVEPVFELLTEELKDYTPGSGGQDLRGAPGDDPHDRPQGGDEADEDLQRLELRQVLPRRPDGAGDGAAPGPDRQLGQAGHRHALLVDLRPRRVLVPLSEGTARARTPRASSRSQMISMRRMMSPGRPDDDAGDGAEPRSRRWAARRVGGIGGMIPPASSGTTSSGTRSAGTRRSGPTPP